MFSSASWVIFDVKCFRNNFNSRPQIQKRLNKLCLFFTDQKIHIRCTVVMVAAQRTRLDLPRRAAQRGKFQQFCSAVPRSVNEDGTTSLH